MATNTEIGLVGSNQESHFVKPLDHEDYSDDEESNVMVMSPRTHKHKVSRSVSPQNNQQLETNKESHNIKLKLMIAVSCIFFVGFLFGVGYIIYNGSDIVNTKLIHNSATKEQCDFMEYDYQNCTYSCNCGQSGRNCEQCDGGIQYKYYAISVDKCGNDTILTAQYTDCYRNRIESLRNLSVSVDCYISDSDCDENVFRFEYQHQDISNGIWWIIGGCLLFCCPFCCFVWFCKQYICYDLKR